jgi:hypothetical protein
MKPVQQVYLVASEITLIIEALNLEAISLEWEKPMAGSRNAEKLDNLYALAGRLDDLR